MFDPEYPVAGLQPVDYNPRAITPEALDALKRSVGSLGMLKAVIVGTNGRLIAGHQRTTALRALGRETTPAFILDDVSRDDEVRFNQLHNASDIEVGAVQASVGNPRARGTDLDVGWHHVPHEFVAGDLKPPYAVQKGEILRLLAKHGEWGNCVATPDGTVIVSGLYALACKILRMPVRVRVVDYTGAAQVALAFGRRYGAFSYEHLTRTTWMQGRAQLNRLRRETKGRSRTYEQQVIPYLKPGMRVLDFGCGQGDYVRKLAREGVDIHGVEFYAQGAGLIDTDRVHRDVEHLCRELRTRGRGRYDLVVCDSVVNSTDSKQAEVDVLTTVNALCRPGGRIVISGRSRAFIEKCERFRSMDDATHRYVQFLDDDGYTAMYNKGSWTFQRFHRAEELPALAACYIGPEAGAYRIDGRPAADGLQNSAGWCIAGTKTTDLYTQGWPGHTRRREAHQAIYREFDLPLPDGTSYGHGWQILNALDWATSYEEIEEQEALEERDDAA